MKEEKIKKNSGFGLIEVLVSLLIIGFLILGIYGLIILSLKTSQDNKYYTLAIEIANQKMEEIRNFPYEDVGTTNGSPVGKIQEFENINRGGNFVVHTTVMFYDDSYDGTLVAGTDNVFTDYKIVTVDVSWQGKFELKNVTIFSKVIPNTEETLAGYGLLKISAVDSNGQPVSGADIHVVNSALATYLDAHYASDAQGSLSLPVLPALNSYEVTVTKDGYSTEKTYARDTNNPNPTKPNYSVFQGQKTEDSFSIDRLANVNLQILSANLPVNFRVNSLSQNSLLLPRVATDGYDNSYFVWQSQINSTLSEIYVQKFGSSNLKSWQNDKKIDSGANPDVAATGAGDLFVAWQNNNLGNNEIYFKGFDSSGVGLFSSELVNSEGDASEQINPRIVSIGSLNRATTTVVWQDKRKGNWDIYAQSFDKNGSKLWPNDLAVASESDDEISPSVAIDIDGNILVVWTRNSSGGKIYAQEFDKAGAPVWPQAMLLCGDSSIKTTPSAVFGEDGNFYLVYGEESGSSKDVVLAKFNQAAYQVWEKNINQEAQEFIQYSPSVVYQDNNIYTAWSDKRSGDDDVYSQKFDVNGNALWPRDFRVNTTLNLSSQNYSDMAIKTNGDCIAAWQDSRGGQLNIYAANFRNFSSENGLANSTVSVTGTKRIGENPVIYKYDKEFTSDSDGNINLPLEWDTPGYTIKLKSGEIEASEPEQPIVVAPSENKIIRIYK
ncbi:MAG: prepilin-type N-terminal cleavage/methylation domain-containing protein [Patescibacteria group bacterium]|nr:prepilin-type N-terminal cleavage/methylation domain-containing protein [Patescibacteria group bacterium]MDD4610840.1 prepilin-type N-terminal cleavage/methylation domain-containing protein [Patescibacteria group bacterium]